jgi:hypothetical protein
MMQWPENTRSVLLSPAPLDAYTYPARHLPDCIATRLRLYSLFPITSLLADGFIMIFAPALQSSPLGGALTHKSSQISVPTIAPLRSLIIIFGEKGTVGLFAT